MTGFMYVLTTVAVFMLLTNVFALCKLLYLRLRHPYEITISMVGFIVEIKNSIYMVVLSVFGLWYVFLLVSNNSVVSLLVGFIPFIALIFGFVPFIT